MDTFDHMKLIDNDSAEVARMRCVILTRNPGDLRIMHEADESCCHQEAWNDTFRRLYEQGPPNHKVMLINLPEGM